MGEQNIKGELDADELRAFSRRLLDDLRAFELMLERDMFESGVRRIGAEQEMFLVDAKGTAQNMALPMLDALKNPAFTTELAQFNLEFNLQPQVFGADCLSRLEADIKKHLRLARKAAKGLDIDVLLTGILPTISLNELTLESMTPMPRYFQLNNVLAKLRGGAFHAHVKGLDELVVAHDNILLEACNTSFQVHFQVSPGEFAQLYNLAQAVTGPVLACAVNSPLLLYQRLWMETRVALFQQSIDQRSVHQSARGNKPRVSFGTRWVRESVAEIFKEDIARYRVLLSTEADEDPIACVERGEAPKLSALRLHNGTVYRWNRPCYGINDDGKAHIRIENRVLPAGPTPVDEVANAAFYFGLMSGMGDAYGDITKVLDFDHAQANFVAGAQKGLKAQLTWVGGKDIRADALILDELLPIARDGLAKKGVIAKDIDRYLGVIEGRVRKGQTGAQWMLDSLKKMDNAGTRDERVRAIVVASLQRQKRGRPVHTWRLAALHETKDWRDSYRYVGQFMSSDVFTVRPVDIVDIAASVMDWEHIRHVPVEDDEGHLVGLITMRDLLKVLAKGLGKNGDPISVSEVMNTELITVPPDFQTVDALRLMRDRNIGCLPVVENDRMVGIITDKDMLQVATGWMEDQLETLGG